MEGIYGNHRAGSTLPDQVAWMGDRPIAVYGRNINGSTAADVQYLHVDLLNTPRRMTTSTKSIGWTWNSDPWGNGTGGALHLRFPGMYYDQQDGNMQNWMRDYDPPTGRYLQSDPIGLNGGINTYTYTEGNPLIRFDPWGLSYAYYSNGSLAIYDKSGNYVGSYPAANVTDSHSRGPVAPDWYSVAYYNRDASEANPESAVGSYGVYCLNVNGDNGKNCIGLHSGRATTPDLKGRTGVRHATMGCIRTTDEAMKRLYDLGQSGDPLTAVGVGGDDPLGDSP